MSFLRSGGDLDRSVILVLNIARLWETHDSIHTSVHWIIMQSQVVRMGK